MGGVTMLADGSVELEYGVDGAKGGFGDAFWLPAQELPPHIFCGRLSPRSK